MAEEEKRQFIIFRDNDEYLQEIKEKLETCVWSDEFTDDGYIPAESDIVVFDSEEAAEDVIKKLEKMFLQIEMDKRKRSDFESDEDFIAECEWCMPEFDSRCTKKITVWTIDW